MNDFAQSVGAAPSLIVHACPELLSIVTLSLHVSVTASLAALLIGAPIGAGLAIVRFRELQVIIVLTNALLGPPRVVAGRRRPRTLPPARARSIRYPTGMDAIEVQAVVHASGAPRRILTQPPHPVTGGQLTGG
jgi:hypothetical protein